MRRRAVVLTAVLAATVVASPAADASPVSAASCRAVQLPVALDSDGATNAELSGDICGPTRTVPALGTTVQVLVAGTAYGKSYWDFPYQPGTYSYVRAANAAGYTTFNVDRIGIGGSSHPPSPQITIPSNAFTIHQAIQSLRAGAVDGVRYDRVVLVGHSMGSLIAWYEAAQYQDVDAVISSGILHSFDGPAVARFGTTLYPAALDPRFADQNLDPGYLTTKPGTRAESFYYAPGADRKVIRIDEATKETATFFEAADVFGQELPGMLSGARNPLCPVLGPACEGPAQSFWFGVTTKITVPVLTVVGQYDTILCGTSRPNRCADDEAVRQDESRYFRGPTLRCLVFSQMPDAGHDLNLHRNAPAWFALANQWARNAVRPNGPCRAGSPASAGTAASPSPPSP
jgi:pimeloyl-ACP methyl ester carboxylesterase